MECLPGSTLPDDLRALGHDVVATGEGERILHDVVVQLFVTVPNGDLEPLTNGSTRPVTLTVTHAVSARL